jgi:hypothetical protein
MTFVYAGHITTFREAIPIPEIAVNGMAYPKCANGKRTQGREPAYELNREGGVPAAVDLRQKLMTRHRGFRRTYSPVIPAKAGIQAF